MHSPAESRNGRLTCAAIDLHVESGSP
jgi:hypothetical protein